VCSTGSPTPAVEPMEVQSVPYARQQELLAEFERRKRVRLWDREGVTGTTYL